MRELSSDLQGRLDGGATTLCHIWILTRRDGTTLGFTDHDTDITFAGVSCSAATGFDATDTAEKLGLAVSGGFRDDLIQRRALEAMLAHFDPAFGADNAKNPPAILYPGRMVEPSGLTLWAWDARPFPAFPRATTVWADGDNWRTGHWLNGRLGAAPLGDLVAALTADFGLSDIVVGDLDGCVDGFVIDRPMSLRSALETVFQVFAIDAHEEGGHIIVTPRRRNASLTLSAETLVEFPDKPIFTRRRGQDSELPMEMTLGYTDPDRDFRASSVASRRLAVASRRVQAIEVPVVAERAVMAGQAEALLQDIWAGRESFAFTVPASLLRLVPGDVVSLTHGGLAYRLLIETVSGDLMRRVTARALGAPATRDPTPPSLPLEDYAPPAPLLPPVVTILDLPTLPAQNGVLQFMAVTAAPFLGPMNVWRSTGGGSFEVIASLSVPSIMGRTLTPLSATEPWRWNRASTLDVVMEGGALSSASEMAVLAGGNALALESGDGWEIVQFSTATLIGAGTYRLSGLLRGVGGSEAKIASNVAAGARLVLIDDHILPLTTSADWIGRDATYRVGPSQFDSAHPAVTEIAATANTTALRPLVPVHLSAVYQGADLALSWIRRTRIDGDNWELADVPLGEESEAYRVTILTAGGVVKRQFDINTPAALYKAADQIADFGGPPASLRFSVAQLSALVGPGFAGEATITF